MKILDRLPISEKRTSLQFGNKYVTVRRNQVLAWVSVHLAKTLEPESSIPKSPALLDTGNNFAFSLQDRLLREWAGIDPSLLVSLGEAEINGQAVTCRRATVWRYPNSPGRQEVASDRLPFRLKMSKGIAVYPPDAVPPPRGSLCSGFPPSSTTTSIGGSILSDDPSPCSHAPGAGTSSVSCADGDASLVYYPRFLERASPGSCLRFLTSFSPFNQQESRTIAARSLATRRWPWPAGLPRSVPLPHDAGAPLGGARPLRARAARRARGPSRERTALRTC